MLPDISTSTASLNSLVGINGMDPKTTAIMMGVGIVLVAIVYLFVEKKGPFK